jgi:hypothetical protein
MTSRGMPEVSGSASMRDWSQPVKQAPMPSAIAAEAPGVTRAASTPIRPAIVSPLRSSNSTMSMKCSFDSLIAAQTAGDSREPPRSV